MRRNTKAQQSVSLFPFLAVLICTMGALVLLLLGLTQAMRRQAVAQREANRAVAAPRQTLPLASLRPPPVPAPGGFDRSALAARASQLELERQQRWNQLAVAARAEREEIEAELSRRRAQRDELAEQLLALSQQLDAVAGEAGAASVASEVAEEQQRELEARHARLSEQIALTERKIDQQKLRQTTSPNEYAIVPYDGASGTPRRPIYIECTETGFRFLPEDVFLGVRELKAGTSRFNALVTGTQALLRFWTLKHERSPDRVPKPYILLLVRPHGIYAYDVARTVLSRFDVPFGYELVDDGIVLQKLPPDPQALAVLKQAVALAVELGEPSGQEEPGGRRDVQAWDDELGRPAEKKTPQPSSISGRSRSNRASPAEEADGPELSETSEATYRSPGMGGSGDGGSGDGESGHGGADHGRRGDIGSGDVAGQSRGSRARGNRPGIGGDGSGQRGAARPAGLSGREPRESDGAPRSLESDSGAWPRDLTAGVAGDQPEGSRPGRGRPGSSAGVAIAGRPTPGGNGGTLKEPQYGAPAAPAAGSEESAGVPGGTEGSNTGSALTATAGDEVRTAVRTAARTSAGIAAGSTAEPGGGEPAAATEESIESLVREETQTTGTRGGAPGSRGGQPTNERAPIQKPENPAAGGGAPGGSPQFGGSRGRGQGAPGRNLIGLERKIKIRVEGERVVVGDEDPLVVPVRKGPKGNELVSQVTAAMGRVVDSWGPPPERFYWIPGVRFEVTTEGNAVYERLRGALTRQKVSTTVDYVDSPSSTRRGGGR